MLAQKVSKKEICTSLSISKKTYNKLRSRIMRNGVADLKMRKGKKP